MRRPQVGKRAKTKNRLWMAPTRKNRDENVEMAVSKEDWEDQEWRNKSMGRCGKNKWENYGSETETVRPCRGKDRRRWSNENMEVSGRRKIKKWGGVILFKNTWRGTDKKHTNGERGECTLDELNPNGEKAWPIRYRWHLHRSLCSILRVR